MERKCVRSTKHTKDKRESTNTRIDWFGCRVFWPSSILFEWLNEKKPPTKINITQPKFVISMTGNIFLLFDRIIINKFCSVHKKNHIFFRSCQKTHFWSNFLEQCFSIYWFAIKNWIYSLYYYQIYINLWWWVCEPLTLLQWPTLIIHWNYILNINEESDLNNKRQWLINIATSWAYWVMSMRERKR